MGFVAANTRDSSVPGDVDVLAVNTGGSSVGEMWILLPQSREAVLSLKC